MMVWTNEQYLELRRALRRRQELLREAKKLEQQLEQMAEERRLLKVKAIAARYKAPIQAVYRLSRLVRRASRSE